MGDLSRSKEWQDGYDTGYQDGESSLLADVNTLCDQLDIEVGDLHEFEAIRREVRRLRASLRGRTET